MTPAQFKSTIERLGLSQEQAGLFFGRSKRQGQRWASGETPIPRSVELLARVMLKYGLEPADLD